MISLAERLEVLSRTRGEQAAIERVAGATQSWATVGRRAQELAAALARSGHRPGDVVAVGSAQRDLAPTLVHGVLRAGGVTLPVDVKTPREGLRELVTRAHASFAAGDEGLLEDLGASAISSLGSGLGVGRLADASPLAVADLATLIATSGSSGKPKLVMLTQRALLAQAERLATIRQHTPEDRHLSFLAFSHFAEHFMSCWLHVVVGYRLVVTAEREIGGALRQTHPTFVMAVPSELEAIRLAMDQGSKPERRIRAGLDRVRLMLTTGAPLSPELALAFEGVDLPLCSMYGMTESTGAATFNGSEPSVRRAHSVGRAMPGGQIEISDDGEVQIVSPVFQSPGYVDDPEATATTFAHGRIHTGDRGRLDEDGFLYLEGRASEMIVLATGKKTYPGPIEAKLVGLAGIRHAAIFGEGESFLVALLDATSEPGAVAAEIARLNQTLPSHERIRAHAVIPPLSEAKDELTSSGKIRRKAIGARHADELARLFVQGRRPGA